MTIENFIVKRDSFEPDDTVGTLCFPCCACIYREKSHLDMPCRRCDHNAAADKDDAP
jgi:hypothetical protein